MYCFLLFHAFAGTGQVSSSCSVYMRCHTQPPAADSCNLSWHKPLPVRTEPNRLLYILQGRHVGDISVWPCVRRSLRKETERSSLARRVSFPASSRLVGSVCEDDARCNVLQIFKGLARLDGRPGPTPRTLPFEVQAFHVPSR